MSWFRRAARFFLVTAGIVLLTSLGIDATQYFEGSNSALSILTQEALQQSCPDETATISVPGGSVCIDRYEASASEDCQFRQPGSIAETASNANQAGCLPVSRPNVLPWRNVNYHQASALCAKASKRLALPEEWYRAALGTPDSALYCNINSRIDKTGSAPECVSGAGVYDAIGNAWEWIDGEVVNGSYQGRLLPENGFVSNADTAGVALATASSSQLGFNRDYFWSKASGTLVMMRGGFYASGDDAGLFAIHADMDPSFSGEAIGFRCAMMINQ